MPDFDLDPTWTVDEILAANGRPPVQEGTGGSHHYRDDVEKHCPAGGWRDALTRYGLLPPAISSR